MSDGSDFHAALDALPASPKRPTAAEVVRKNLEQLRRRKREGVDELELLDLVNKEARSPISLITLRCYLARRAGRSDITYEPTADRSSAKREEPNTAWPPRPGTEFRATSQAGERPSARTEQRGVTQPIKPGPVE